MNVIFGRKDFIICNVPTPKGYPQSQTHSGVAIYNGKFFLTTSPFPSMQEKWYKAYFKAVINKLSCGLVFNEKREETYENPCLYIDENNGNIPYPSDFSLMQQKPLMDTPEEYYGLPAFNSDPDLYIEEGKIFVLNRPVYRTKLCPGEPLNKYEVRVYLISGEIDNDRFKLEQILRLLSTEDRMMASPCFFKYNGVYHLIELETNSYNDGQTFDGLYGISSDSIYGLKDNDYWKKIEVDSSGLLPWHMSVFQYKGKQYSIIACIKKGEKQRCWQMFGEFNDDLTKLKIYKMPLTDYKSYRGSALVTEEGEFVLYSTTVHEHINGSKSVDGRDVIMAHMPFDKMLAALRED